MPPDRASRPHRPIAQSFRRHAAIAAWLALPLLAGAAFFGWQHLYPVQSAPGWSYSVFLDDFPMVSALALDPAGRLYATHELRQNQGLVVRLDPNGERVPVVSGLNKPDGLAAFMGGVAISQESADHPLLLLRDDTITTLFVGNSIEGISSDGQRLFAIEDVKDDGRLLQYDPATKELRVLRDRLAEGEGVAVCPNGDLFYTEKKAGWIKKYQAAAADGRDPVVVSGLNAPGYLLCGADGLWITEDATHMSRLLLLTPAGVLQTVLSHLRAAQTLIALDADRLLLAEQGRDRILQITRPAHAQR